MSGRDGWAHCPERAAWAAGEVVAASLRVEALRVPAGWPHGADDALRSSLPEQVRPFVAYAGVLATAREAWEERTPGDPDDAFDGYLARALAAWPGAASELGAAEFALASQIGQTCGEQARWRWLPGVQHAWRGELEEVWPVVARVAEDLRAGEPVDAERLRDATDAHLAASRG